MSIIYLGQMMNINLYSSGLTRDRLLQTDMPIYNTEGPRGDAQGELWIPSSVETMEDIYKLLINYKENKKQGANTL